MARKILDFQTDICEVAGFLMASSIWGSPRRLLVEEGMNYNKLRAFFALHKQLATDLLSQFGVVVTYCSSVVNTLPPNNTVATEMTHIFRGFQLLIVCLPNIDHHL